MANLIRIKNLERETNLDNIVIPVDKASYLDNAKQISITGLTGYVLSGFTGSTINYSHPGTTTVIVGGIPIGVQITGMTITEIFNWMLYSGNPPTTTTTTPSPTTTTTTPAPTTTTTTPAPTTTTTTPAPTTTTTTTVSTDIHITNQHSVPDDDIIITDIKIGGVSIIGSPINSGDPSVDLIVNNYGSLLLDIYYTYNPLHNLQKFNISYESGCHNVTSGSPYSTLVNFPVIGGINIYAWTGNC